MTRLDEFLPVGRFYSLGIFLNNRSSSDYLATSFHGTSNVLTLTKNGLLFWLILQNSSGHPVSVSDRIFK
jgi:hypothetical protein